MLICIDILNRSLNFTEHYGAHGVMPLYEMIVKHFNYEHFSLYFIHQSYLFTAILFALTFVSGVAVAVGFRTRTFLILAWVLVVSLHNRNYMVLQGGDEVLRMLMLWGIFLPLGRVWSFDQTQNAEPVKSTQMSVISVATVAVIVQLIVLYTSTALLKSGHSWTQDYTAGALSLHSGPFVTHFGKWLRQFEPMLAFGTFATYYLELFGTLLFIVPVLTGWFRLIGIIAFVMLHINISLTLNVGLFPLINIISFLPLLPAEFWQKALPHQQPKQPPSPLAEEEASLSAQVICFILLIISVLGSFPPTKNWSISRHPNFIYIQKLLRLDANWGMFAPNPPKISYWYVIEGEFSDGKKYNIAIDKKEELSDEIPPHIADRFRSQRWRKYLDNLANSRNKKNWVLYANYICRRWQEAPDQPKLKEFRIYNMKYSIKSDFSYSPVNKEHKWHWVCPN